MAAPSTCTRFFFGITLLYLLQFPVASLAQRGLRDINGLPWPDEQVQSEAETAIQGCQHSIDFPQVALSIEESCSKADSMELILPLGPDPRGYSREKRVRGTYEFHEYQLTQLDQEATFKNLIGLMPMSGFKVKYSQEPAVITAQKGEIWALINVSGETYNVTLVRGVDAPWTPITTAAEISREMQAHDHADIYGIQFSPTNKIDQDQSPMLPEMLKFLNDNPTLAVVIQSHKWSKGVPPEVDSEITRERANAVMDWLVAHGIARTRVQPRPYGRDNPLTENETASEIQRNDRIVLARAKTQAN
jgi:OmpA family protein